jgi:hypothetical protein
MVNWSWPETWRGRREESSELLEALKLKLIRDDDRCRLVSSSVLALTAKKEARLFLSVFPLHLTANVC